MLDPVRLVPYLQRRRLLSSDSILNGDVRIECTDRRNHNLHVRHVNGTGYFVKQSRDDRDGVGTLVHEARVYSAFENAAQSHVRKHLPRSYGYDERDRLLLLESVPHAEDLWCYHTRLGRFPVCIASETGRALGIVHEETTNWTIDERVPAYSTSPMPFVFQLLHPSAEILRTISAAGLHLIRIVQESRTIEEAFTSLASNWRTESLIHGDIRLRNILTYRRARRGRCHGIKLVDWEFARLGDPRWDVGSLFSSYLSLWASSVPIPRTDQPNYLIELAKYPLERIKPAMAALWRGYRDVRQWDEPSAALWLTQALRFAAAHLIHSAYEIAECANDLTSESVVLVQIAINALERSDDAVGDLLGININ